MLIVAAGGVAGARPCHAERPRAQWAACAVGEQGPSGASWCSAGACVGVERDHGRVLRGSFVVHGGAALLLLDGFVVRGCRARAFGADRGCGRVGRLDLVGVVAGACRGRGLIVRVSAAGPVVGVGRGRGPVVRGLCGRIMAVWGCDLEHCGVVFHPVRGRWQVVPVGSWGSGGLRHCCTGRLHGRVGPLPIVARP